MEKIKKNDFVEVEYTGRIKDTDQIFDTTDEDVAKKNDIHSHSEYGPVIVCVGQEQVVSGIDKSLDGKEIGQEYEVDVGPEDSFGNKNAKLIQLIPTSKFKKQNIQPMPGLQLNIDGMVGTVKTVTGGRTLVDFNHPLAGREIIYKVKINKKVTDNTEKLKNYLQLNLGTKEIDVNGTEVSLKKGLPEEVEKNLIKKIESIIPEMKGIKFVYKNK
jgi:FKBP-type peptidyl-prolyl cis-trans isomerase 2